VNRSKFRTQEAFNGQQAEFRPYEIGMQLPFGLDSKVLKKKALWGVADLPGAMFKGPRFSKGESDFRRTSEARPCSYVDVESSQVFAFSVGSFSQGQGYHKNCPSIPWEEKEFYGSRV
jgi:hypothetical protein